MAHTHDTPPAAEQQQAMPNQPQCDTSQQKIKRQKVQKKDDFKPHSTLYFHTRKYSAIIIGIGFIFSIANLFFDPITINTPSTAPTTETPKQTNNVFTNKGGTSTGSNGNVAGENGPRNSNNNGGGGAFNGGGGGNMFQNQEKSTEPQAPQNQGDHGSNKGKTRPVRTTVPHVPGSTGSGDNGSRWNTGGSDSSSGGSIFGN